MTRRGSLAYYLAAWAFGCFFQTLCFAGLPTSSRFPPGIILGMIYFYFLALIFGAFTCLLFGFSLRRLTQILHLVRAWQWILIGAVLAPSLVAFLGVLSHDMRWSGFLHSFQTYFLYAGQFIVSGGARYFWRVIPAGAATAWVLFRVQRAFVLNAENSRDKN